MRWLSAFALGMASLFLGAQQLRAGLIVTDAGLVVSAEVTSGDGLQANDGDAKISVLNDTLTHSGNLALGTLGDKGQYSFGYTAGNTYGTSGSQTNFSVSATNIVDGDSNSAPEAFSGSTSLAYIQFTIDEAYVATLDFTGALTQFSTTNLSSINIVTSIDSPSFMGPMTYGMDFNTDSGLGTSGVTFPISFNLDPGNYTFAVSVYTRLRGPFDVQGISSSGTSTLSLVPVAVPEPASLVVLSCAAAIVVPELRSRIKRRKASA